MVGLILTPTKYFDLQEADKSQQNLKKKKTKKVKEQTETQKIINPEEQKLDDIEASEAGSPVRNKAIT